jgi:hypothetical protein
MKFFTPQLYQQFNSPDDEEADRANVQWEETLRGYQQHLSAIREGLPSQIIKLAELDLHDAEILAQSEDIQSAFLFPEVPFPCPVPVPFWSAVAVLTVHRKGEALSLISALWDRVREQSPPEGWRFSKLRPHWLYEELDWIQDRRGGLFFHRILLSDGRVLEIPFLSVVIHHFSLPSAESEGRAKASA